MADGEISFGGVGETWVLAVKRRIESMSIWIGIEVAICVRVVLTSSKWCDSLAWIRRDWERRILFHC